MKNHTAAAERNRKNKGNSRINPEKTALSSDGVLQSTPRWFSTRLFSATIAPSALWPSFI
jgi:hypothetical protein